MHARLTVARLLAMTADPDSSLELLDAQLDDAAIELLNVLCRNLAFAVAAASGKSAHKNQACERAAEYVAGIGMVLEAWQSCDVVVIDGPRLQDSPLTERFLN